MIHESPISGERGPGSATESASHGPLLQNQGPRQRPDSSRAPRAKCKTSSIRDNKQRFKICPNPVLISQRGFVTKNSVRRPETDSISECALILVDGPIRGQIRFGLTNDRSSWILDVSIANDVGPCAVIKLRSTQKCNNSINNTLSFFCVKIPGLL